MFRKFLNNNLYLFNVEVKTLTFGMCLNYSVGFKLHQSDALTWHLDAKFSTHIRQYYMTSILVVIGDGKGTWLWGMTEIARASS